MRILILIGLFALPLQLLAQTQTFGGLLLDEKTNREQSEVEITIINKDTGKEYVTETDDDGKFLYKKIPVGWYTLKITDKDFVKPPFDFEITPTHKPDLDFFVNRKVSWMWNWGDRGAQEHYYSHLVSKIIIYIYFACLILILFYSILQVSLAIAYVRNKIKVRKHGAPVEPVFDPATAPKVTVQLPMYNEMYVAERIIEKISEL